MIPRFGLFGVIFLSVAIVTVIATGIFYANRRNAPIDFGGVYGQFSNIDTEILKNLPPIAVMVENELNARPWQQGLSFARIVYEASAEGGITRFLAIYSPLSYFGKLGPVRSARSYFLDIAHEYGALYAHVGGRFDAIERLNHEEGIFDADQYAYENYFWRENVGKTALEHTMFTDGKTLTRLALDKNWTAPGTPPSSGAFINQAQNGQNYLYNADLESFPKAREIKINFGFPAYSVSYSYDKEKNLYMRSQAGAPHLDNANKEQISASAIIVQQVEARPNGDPSGSISMKIIGSGASAFFSEGRAISGIWEKSSLNSPTEFFDGSGRKFAPRGERIWIEILPLYNSFSYK